MKLSSVAVFFIFTLGQATLFSASAGVYEYDWVGGQSHFSGKIFLDAPSSVLAPHGGTDADVLPGSFVSTSLGTFSVLDSGLDAAYGPGAITWDASHISSMWLFFDSITPINNPAYSQPAIGSALAGDATYGNAIVVGSLVGGFTSTFTYDDNSGSWLAAPVPEPSATALILLGAAAGSVGCGFSARKKTV